MQGIIISSSIRCKHHLQQDPRPGAPSADHLSEPARCDSRGRGGRQARSVGVPASVPQHALELQGHRKRAARLRPTAPAR